MNDPPGDHREVKSQEGSTGDHNPWVVLHSSVSAITVPIRCLAVGLACLWKVDWDVGIGGATRVEAAPPAGIRDQGSQAVPLSPT